MPCDQGTPAQCKQANHKLFHPLPGMRGLFASCEYPINTDFYSPSADLTEQARNSLSGSAQLVEAEPEAMCEH